MNTKLQQSKDSGSAGDLARYAASLLLIAAGLAVFYWFDGQWPTSLRALVVVAGLVAATLVFLTTRKGGHTREFLSEARFELRKVVWPTRQEAMRTTWVVIAVVIVLSLLLALYDVIIQSAVKWLLAVHS
jgi:preprotein translocase subunit SecE